MYLTERLKIRLFIERDLAPLNDLFLSKEAMRFIGPRRAMSADETEEWLKGQLLAQSVGIARHAVALKDSDELIGVCGFQKIDAEWDFGYYFRQSFWGQGYATEACACLLEQADAILDGESYFIFVAEGNVASHRVMERCGWHRAESAQKDGESGYYYRRTALCTATEL